MTGRGRILQVLIGFAGLAVVVWVGTVLGLQFGKYRLEVTRPSRQAQLQELLEKNIHGIAVERPFPDVPVWSVDGTTAHRVCDLLPKGGIIFYVSSQCASCVDAIAALDSGLAELDAKGAPRKSVIIISTGDITSLGMQMSQRGITIPLYCDVEERLFHEHNVRTTRTYFDLDENCVLQRMGAAGFRPSEYASILVRN